MPATFGFAGFGIDPAGFPFINLDTFEEREIVVAIGIDAHDADVHENWHLFKFLKDRLPDFKENSPTEGEFTNAFQKVHYKIRIIHSKKEFREALENPDLHVVYDGHARYGRGACFEVYNGEANQEGEQWESGTGDKNGIFRLGYPFVPVDVDDFDHHKYTFRPVPGEEDPPDRDDRHPEARRGLSRLKMPEDHRGRVKAGHESPDHKYWGFMSKGKPHFLLHANWKGSHSAPFDLGGTDLKCKVFCHFGCSSRLHFREIVRGEKFKGWIRPDPPTEKFAYFTSAASNAACTPIWVHAVLTYAEPNNFQSWFASLEDAKKRTNKALKKKKQKYEVF